VHPKIRRVAMLRNNGIGIEINNFEFEDDNGAVMSASFPEFELALIEKSPYERNYQSKIDTFNVDAENGALIDIEIDNNGSIWTNAGLGADAAEGCDLDSLFCGNNVLVKVGENVVGVLENVEGSADKITTKRLELSPEQARIYAEELGVDVNELPFDLVIIHDNSYENSGYKGYSLSASEIDVTVLEPPVTTTTTTEPPTTTQPPATTTTVVPTTTTTEVPPTTQPPTSTTEVPPTTTEIPTTTTVVEQPPKPPELAMTGVDNPLTLLAGSGALIAAGVLARRKAKNIV
jgi:hypothetical protein